MAERTRIELGRREDLGADCANCFGLCCVALAFSASADFPFDKPAGEPCENLDEADACRIHPHLRDRGFKGCTVFDCFGAGQKVSRQTFAGRSWRTDPGTRGAMFATFPIVRRLHELLWYLDEAITLVETHRDAAPWSAAFEHVRQLSDGTADELARLDVDAEYDAVRGLLVEASAIVRADFAGQQRQGGGGGGGGGGRARRTSEPGSDLIGARLAGRDLRGSSIRGSIAIAADFSGAQMQLCDVLGVDMRDADLAGADLDGAIYLTQMQVNSARGDSRTVLPEGFDRPSHWTGTAAR